MCGRKEARSIYNLPLCPAHVDFLPAGPTGPTWEAVPPYEICACGRCGQVAYALEFRDFDPAKYDGTHIPHRPSAWIVQAHQSCPYYEAQCLDPRVPGDLHIAVPQDWNELGSAMDGATEARAWHKSVLAECSRMLHVAATTAHEAEATGLRRESSARRTHVNQVLVAAIAMLSAKIRR